MPLSIEEIRRRLKSRNDLDDQELDVLFSKNDDDIREFYSNVVLKQKTVGETAATGEAAWDDLLYTPTANEQAIIDSAKIEKKRKEKQKAAAQAAQATKIGQPDDAPQQSAPKGSFDEWLKKFGNIS